MKEENVRFLTRQELLERARRPGGVSAKDIHKDYPHCKVDHIYAVLESLTIHEGVLRATSSGGLVAEPTNFRFQAAP